MKTTDMLQRLSAARREQNSLTSYILKQDARVGKIVEKCGSWLHLREFLPSGSTRVMRANFCKRSLLCRACAIRRTAKCVALYTPKVAALIAKQPSLKSSIITLTIRNGPDLAERCTHLKKSLSRMYAAKRKAQNNPGKNLVVEWNKVIGSIRSIEITKGNGGWHPHVHAYCLSNEEISAFHLSAEWSRFSHDSDVVEVTACENDPLSELARSLIYSTKFSQMLPCDIWEVYRSLAGTHFVESQGALRGPKTADVDSIPTGAECGPYQDFFVSWIKGGISSRWPRPVDSESSIKKAFPQ